MLGVLHGDLEVLLLQLTEVHDLLLEVSLFAEPLEDHHVQF
jgi:hypothetical protein